ncbi:MAG: hypothetical protein WBF84_11975 [Castellaniella sp.]|uniref:tetratricopeptide repeat protein n=1 Tax=Castellaniella sp. TaxID=1955812 RepID=UPI003C70FA64
MSWPIWAEQLRQNPEHAVDDLLRGSADIAPFERLEPHEFLLTVLLRSSRLVTSRLLGEPLSDSTQNEPYSDLHAHLDAGLVAWLNNKRSTTPTNARKLAAYVAQVCEALQWPLYFTLPQTRAALQNERWQWLQWLRSLTLSAYRDPEYDYWQVLATLQTDDALQYHWQTFVVDAGRLRSLRYLNLGLLALARLPLSEEDSLRNLRLQAQALINRYQRRLGWGNAAQEELADSLRSVMARNPSLSADNYRAFLTTLLTPLGEDKAVSVLSLIGLAKTNTRYGTVINANYKLNPPGLSDATDAAVQAVRRSGSLIEAWNAIRPLLTAHEDYLHKSGDAYYFVRNLDRCARALCEKYSLRDPEIQARLFQWIHLALRLEADNPRLWMLWELALRQAGQSQRAQWVLWEMTRRFPDHLPCRVELARLLADSPSTEDQIQSQHLLQQVLRLDPEHLHAHSTLAQLAIRQSDWEAALNHARNGLRIDPHDDHCVLLLANAQARRNEPGDLQTAIDELQRFVTRHPGSRITEGYLRNLLLRQQRGNNAFAPEEEDKTTNATPSLPAETDSAWQAFADSVLAWSNSPERNDAAVGQQLTDRVLPLPQALRLAVAQGRWAPDLLDDYDVATQREFPLETRLWRYLQQLHNDSTSYTERTYTRQTVQDWLDKEQRAPSQDNPSWVSYLNLYWQDINDASTANLSSGDAWLMDLLDRHQPLPAPLLA